ncbi:MAG: flagellar basal body P-ring formation chaperone FlgA [Phycisphaeraceae bacterium]
MTARSLTSRTHLACLAALLLCAATTAAHGNSIRLQAAASVAGPEVRLADIAELEGDRAEALADHVVVSFDNDDATRLALRLVDVRQSLDGVNVHWGLVSLRGYASCEVRRAVVHAEPGDAEPVRDEPAAVSNVDAEIDLTTAMSLRGRVVHIIEQLVGVSQDELRIRFADRDTPRLDLSAVAHRFELEPGSTTGLGRVPVTVRRYSGDRVVDEFTVTVDVQRRVMALVATRTVGRGDSFTEGTVRLREVYVGNDRGQPLDDPELVVGQQASGVVREGSVIYPDHVRSPVLVRRGELVTVRAIAGSLVVRAVGRAAEQGSRDEVIQVRNEGSRETFFATITGRREVSVQASPSSSE